MVMAGIVYCSLHRADALGLAWVSQLEWLTRAVSSLDRMQQ